MPTDEHDTYDEESWAPAVMGTKRATGSSATSRKNKLQRCSVCGGLGHKSRTCELAAYKMGAGAQALNMLNGGGSDDDDSKDPLTVLAAYGLLTLAESSPQPMVINSVVDREVASASPSPWMLGPSSPRILAA